VKIATVFSGIGAPEQAASRVFKKVKLVFACEIDKFARKSFEAIYNINPKRFHTDITKTDFSKYRKKVDILIGGSPCQSFSIAGGRAGFEDTRGTLFFDFARCIKECQPKYFIFENVKGIVNHDNGKTLSVILYVFNELGYAITLDILNTKDFGVPQNRERFFVIGKRKHKQTSMPKMKNGKLLKDKMWNAFVGKGLKWFDAYKFPTPIPLEKRLKDVLEDDVDEKYYLSEKAIKGFIHHTNRMQERGNGFNFSPTLGECVASSITTKSGTRPCDNFIKVIGELDIKGNDRIKRVYGDDDVRPALQTMQGGNREPKILVKSATKKGYDEAEYGDSINLSVPNSKTRRGGVGKQVSQTLDTSCNLAFLGDRIRKLTPLECWRLHDFPDEAFNKAKNAGLSDTQLYKQAGNSMSVNVIELLFKNIKKDMEHEKHT